MPIPHPVLARVTQSRGLDLILAAVAVLAASCTSRPPSTATETVVPPERSPAVHAVSGLAEDPLALLEYAEAVMNSLESFEQHVYAVGQVDRSGDVGDRAWELWDTEYRHERPDRMRIVVRTAWVARDYVHRRPSIGIHIGEYAWARDLPSADDAPWECSDGGTTEMPRFFLVATEGDATEYIGLERIGGRAVHVVKVERGSGYEARESAVGGANLVLEGTARPRPDEQDLAAPPTELRYWIDPATSHVLRMEMDRLEAEGGATTEVRKFSAFDTPREIFAPGPCATPRP